jgi:glycerol-3-phosphate dehydrogenase
VGLFLHLGLTIYDMLAGKLSLGNLNIFRRKKQLNYFYNWTKRLISGVIYQDGQFDDSRLAINIAQTAVERRLPLNYTKVVNLLKTATIKLLEFRLKSRNRRIIRFKRKSRYKCNWCIHQCNNEAKRYCLQKNTLYQAKESTLFWQIIL